MIEAANFTAKASGEWKTFGMLHNKICLLENKPKKNFTLLVWKNENGWRSLIKFPDSDDIFLRRKKTPPTQVNGCVFTRMRSRTRHLSFDVPRTTRRFYFKGTIFIIHFRSNALRWASILDALENGRILMGEWTALTIKWRLCVLIEAPQEMERKKRLSFFLAKWSHLDKNANRWRWADGGHFLNYITKAGRDSITNRTPNITRKDDKWQDYLPSNY